jgi:hypothetical protein
MMRERRIGMTERLTSELGILYSKNPDPKALLFGISSVKRSFDKVRARVPFLATGKRWQGANYPVSRRASLYVSSSAARYGKSPFTGDLQLS